MTRYMALYTDQRRKLWRNRRVIVMADEQHDNVNHPAHYTKGGIECIDAIKAAVGGGFEGYLVGNIIKYLFRYRFKGGIEDLKKARWYLEKLIVVLEVRKKDD